MGKMIFLILVGLIFLELFITYMVERMERKKKSIKNVKTKKKSMLSQQPTAFYQEKNTVLRKSA